MEFGDLFPYWSSISSRLLGTLPSFHSFRPGFSPELWPEAYGTKKNHQSIQKRRKEGEGGEGRREGGALKKNECQPGGEEEPLENKGEQKLMKPC